MSTLPTYPVILVPPRLLDALSSSPALATYSVAKPRTEDFPAHIPAGKSALGTVYGLFGLKKQADELLAPERQEAQKRFEAAVRDWEKAKAEFEETERQKVTPDVLRLHRTRQVAALLESSSADAVGESFAPAGVAEQHLLERLLHHFPGRILRRRMLGTGKGAYHPDFLYFDPAKRLRIDIELDEPYGMGHKLPIHFMEGDRSVDHERDQAFLAALWPVVRFSEQQAVENPDGCARVVADLVERLTGQSTPSLAGVLPVASHPRWTRDDANLMAAEGTRDALTANVKRAPPTVQEKKPDKVFKPSPYQQRIFDFLADGQGHGLVTAVAGSGKSTTLLEAAKVIKRASPGASILMLAFNKSIAEELGVKLTEADVRGVETSTLNAFGQKMLAKHRKGLKLTFSKPEGMIGKALRAHGLSNLKPDVMKSAVRLYGLFQSYSQLDPRNPGAFVWMTTQYEEPGMEPLREVIADALLEGQRAFEQSGMITFDDQNYLPVVLNLKMSTYDFVFVDECQDLTQTQLEMVRRIAGEQGRLLFVGDPQQAIMGFRGADNDSVENIKRLPSPPTQLPLTVCYRCPKSHIHLAQELMPQIEAAPTAKDGHVYRATWNQAFEYVQERDLLFARNNRLVDLIVLELLSRGVSLDYEEKKQSTEDGEQDNDSSRIRKVIAELRQAAMNFNPHMAPRTKPTLSPKDQPVKVMLPWVLGRMYAQSERWGGEFPVFVEAMTKPDQRMGVRVSSAHQSKGLEAERVFVMGYELFEKPKSGQIEWEKQQERNLRYVALTRAKDTLFLVNGPMG